MILVKYVESCILNVVDSVRVSVVLGCGLPYISDRYATRSRGESFLHGYTGRCQCTSKYTRGRCALPSWQANRWHYLAFAWF